jgi:hypothetical protein
MCSTLLVVVKRHYSCFFYFWVWIVNMSGQENSIAENNKLEGESNYALWKFQIQTILE